MNFEVRSELMRFDIRHSLFDILFYTILALIFIVRTLGKGKLQYLSNLYCLTGRAGGHPKRFGKPIRISRFDLRLRGSARVLSPHFSPAFYCGGGSGHVYSVALGRAPRHTVKYACGALRN
jgi:hypothetical protein